MNGEASRRRRATHCTSSPCPSTWRRRDENARSVEVRIDDTRQTSDALDGDDTGDNVIRRDNQVLEEVVPAERETERRVEEAGRITWKRAQRARLA